MYEFCSTWLSSFAMTLAEKAQTNSDGRCDWFSASKY